MRNLFRGAGFTASLIVPGIAMFAAIYWINESAVERLIHRDATKTSENAANYFAKNLPGIEDLLQGKPIRKEANEFIARSLESLKAERFKLFDEKGNLLVDSGAAGESDHQEPAGSTNTTALQVFTSGTPSVELEEETEQSGQIRLLAETYVPVIRNGKPGGVAEVYVDETERAAMYSSAFSLASWLAAALAALGFAIPAAALLMVAQKKRQAEYMAQHDALTGIPNRANLLHNARQLEARMNAQGVFSLVHFIDLDHFKDINDQNGHEAGDMTLKIAAERLKEAIPEGDVLVRFGGDEFVVVQFGFDVNEDIYAATQRISDALQQPVSFKGKTIPLSASIGTAVAPLHGNTIEKLINHADQAAYVSKANGRNQQCFFKPQFDEENRSRRVMENLVSTAVSESRLVLHYQPIISFGTGVINGFEALLRMRDRYGKLVSPADFIPMAEDTGAIVDIGTWVLDAACREAASWPPHLTLSVNLSVVQFQRKAVVDATCKALAASGLHASRLLLEITESLMMLNSGDALQQLNQLKALGTSVVIDDFGQGYSNFNYMMKFPVDRIKIDRSFAADVGNQQSDTFAVVKAMVDLCHVLKMKVTAEGVENQEQADSLKRIKCDDVQGFHYSRPVPATEIAALLMRNLADKARPPVPAPALQFEALSA